MFEWQSQACGRFLCLPTNTSFRMFNSDEFDAYIVVSFINATLVLSIGETVEEVTDTGFLGTTPTLSCTQLGEDALLQVKNIEMIHFRNQSVVLSVREPLLIFFLHMSSYWLLQWLFIGIFLLCRYWSRFLSIESDPCVFGWLFHGVTCICSWGFLACPLVKVKMWTPTPATSTSGVFFKCRMPRSGGL